MANLSVARAYQRSFDTHPHTTLALTGGILNSFGDFVAQLSQNTFGREAHETPLGYNFARTFRFFCFGFTISPFIGRWNHFLEYKFPLHSINGSGRASVKALSKRVACDQMIMAPIGLSIFLGSMGIMEGRAPQQIRQKYNDLYKTALLTNWKVWPLAQLINFRYMPLPYRVPFQSTCGVFWTLYLSIINSKEEQKQDRNAVIRRTIDSKHNSMVD